MTQEEQFAALNTPDWLTAFRTAVNNLFDALAAQSVRVPEADFAVQGVVCRIQLSDDPTRATAFIGSMDDGSGWQFTIVAPIGWFRPA